MPLQGLCLLSLAFCLTIIRRLCCALPGIPLRAEFAANGKLNIYCIYTYYSICIAIPFTMVYTSS